MALRNSIQQPDPSAGADWASNQDRHSDMERVSTNFLILGAGPAGLTAAAELRKRGETAVIIEKDPQYVGGISRTETHNGYRFDIGGHRFFSKSGEIMRWWRKALPDDLLQRPRSSMIYFNGKYFAYPLRAGEALMKLGPFTSILCVLDYLKARAFPIRNVRSFEDWVVNNFGRRLFRTFFKTYTEKVWGIPCEEISAEWAAQRIKGFSLGQAIGNAITNSFSRGPTSSTKIKTLIGSFLYPRLGPGQMWDMSRRCRQGGNTHDGNAANLYHKDQGRAVHRRSARWQEQGFGF